MNAQENPSAGKNAPKADALRIIVRSDDVWRGTLAEFIKINEDGVTPMEIQGIFDAVWMDQEYKGGGGAAGEWKVSSDQHFDAEYSLCEAVSDISASFALADQVPGDSREMCRLCIEWAREFELNHKHAVWGETEGPDYIEAIDAFFATKYMGWVTVVKDRRANTDAKNVSKPARALLIAAFEITEGTLRHVNEGTHTKKMVMDAGRLVTSALSDLKSGRVS